MEKDRLARTRPTPPSRRRYYHPEYGRFISRDPIGYDGGMNLYCYAAGRPTGGLDPDGLEIELYIKRTKEAGGVIDVMGGHTIIFVVGNGRYAEFNGGGGSSGTRSSEGKSFVRGAKGERLSPSDFPDLRDNPSNEAIAAALNRIMIKGTPQGLHKDDPK